MSSKKNSWVVYTYKNLMYWFLRGCHEISAQTDVPNLLSIPNCLFPMNWNPVIHKANLGMISTYVLDTWHLIFIIPHLFNFIYISFINATICTNWEIQCMRDFLFKRNVLWSGYIFSVWICDRKREIVLEPCSDVWAIPKSEPTFFGKHNFQLINHEILLKTNMFTSLMTKSLRKFCLDLNLDLCWLYF